MALTDEEKRLLAQLEASLAADDPQLAHRLRGVGPRRLPAKRVALAVAGLAVGIALLVVGIQSQPLLSVLGFLVMLVACVAAIPSWGHDDLSGSRHARPAGRRRPQQRATGTDTEFMDRMEDRWRRRQEGGR